MGNCDCSVIIVGGIANVLDTKKSAFSKLTSVTRPPFSAYLPKNVRDSTGDGMAALSVMIRTNGPAVARIRLNCVLSMHTY